MTIPDTDLTQLPFPLPEGMKKLECNFCRECNNRKKKCACEKD